MADKDLALPGEAYWVNAKIYPRENDKPIELVRTWFLKRQVFSEEEIERSVTYEAEREGLEDREARDRRRESGRGDR